MPFRNPRILIIDDKEEDGIRIAKSIWNIGYPARFIKFDLAKLATQGSDRCKGARVIFMDIDLLGDGIVGDGSKIFSVVQQALLSYLDEGNGPYVLITWSLNDQEADNLFEYLKARMSVAMRPLVCKRLNKEDYTSETGESDLSTKIDTYMNGLEVIRCLIDWERSIQIAGCDTVKELMNIAYSIEGTIPKDAVKHILYALAKADAEKHLTPENAVMHLYSMLSQILYDQAINHLPVSNPGCGAIICSDANQMAGGVWPNKLNAMLHLDVIDQIGGQLQFPGDAFLYPQIESILPLPCIANTGAFMRGNFMTINTGELTAEEKSRLESLSQLLLVEITPSCDFAQKKFLWHKYILAAKVPLEFKNLIWVYNSRESRRETGKLPDYLWISPDFIIDNSEPFVVVFNARLVVSVPPSPEFKALLGSRQFRFRQPLLGDMLGWLARQSSRLGHVSVTS